MNDAPLGSEVEQNKVEFCCGVDFLRCRFRNMGVLRDRVVSPVPNPLTWRTGGSCFVGPLPFDLFGLGGPTRRLSSRRHNSWGVRGTQARQPRQGGDPSGD